ncbi:hypothetical protein EDD86DRAFT_212109 [Gorgonomyces haynaldii]|nr:hypothetical protein EDD86DRAFT_212109 [Gorgonomyces haynaldii]
MATFQMGDIQVNIEHSDTSEAPLEKEDSHVSLKSFFQKKKKPKRTYVDQYGERESFGLKKAFLIEIATDLAKYGVPTHRLEYLLPTMGQGMGLEDASFLVLPGVIMINISDGQFSYNGYKKTQQGFNFYKLAAVNKLCFELIHGDTSSEEALVELERIRKLPNMSLWWHLITYPLTGLMLVIVGFRGTWMDSLVALVMGLVVGCIQVACGFISGLSPINEFASAFFAALFTNLIVNQSIYRFQYVLNAEKIVFSAIAILLPGLNLTLSMIEISTRNMVSGVIRLFSSLFTAMLLGFGLAIGQSVMPLAKLDLPPSSDYPSPYFDFLFVPLLGLVLAVTFEAYPKQWPVMVTVASVGFAVVSTVSRLDAFAGHPEGPTAFAAFAIGLLANLYARITSSIAVAPILAGIIILVPGSYGVRSTLGFITNNSVVGLDVSFQMLIIAISITIGLFLSTLLVWPIQKSSVKQKMFSF